MATRKPDVFTRFATTTSATLGRPWVFTVAVVVLVLWLLSGPILGFSDSWQLIINTSTTIITFLMVFIIQNTQNRDNMAINIKLDAIMKEQGIQSDKLFGAEDDSDEHLEAEKRQMERSHKGGTHGKRTTRSRRSNG